MFTGQGQARRGVLGTYSLLILLVITSFVLPLFESVQGRLYTIFFSAIFLAVVLLVRKRRMIVFAVVVVALILKWLLAPALKNFYLVNLAEFLNTLVFLYAVGTVIMLIVQTPKVDEKVILDAISGYLLLGLAATTLVIYLHQSDPASFTFPEEETQQISDYIYFSFVTLSTLGYGDIVPKTGTARTLATLISVTGQMYVAIVVALLVGKFASGPLEEK